MPDLARNEDEKQCFEQLQKYSKRLLEYFDYYWKTPKEDCTISGRDMDLLKTYPAKRFEYKNKLIILLKNILISLYN